MHRNYSQIRSKLSKEEYDFHLKYGFREGFKSYSNRSYFDQKGETASAQATITKSWARVRKIATWIFIASVVYHIAIYIIFKYAFNPSKKQVKSLIIDSERARSW